MAERGLADRRPGPVSVLLVLVGIALVSLAIGGLAGIAGAAGPSPGAAGQDAANVSVYRATAADLGDAGAIEAAIANGTFEPADRVVLGDRLVVVIESDRLADSMAAGNGTGTARFLAALDGEAAFRLVQTNHGPMVSPMFASVGPENGTVFRSGQTTYVVVDTHALAFRNPGSKVPPEIHGGDRFAVEFGYDLPESRFRTAPGSPEVTLYRTASEFRLAGTWNEPLPPEWIRRHVAVNVAPEASVAVRLRLDAERTIRANATPIEIPGRATVWLDLRDVEPGTRYTLDLVYDGRVLERYEGTVSEPRATLSNATLRTDENGTAAVATATLSHGGAIQVLTESCEDVGWHWLDPRNETRVSIPLWGPAGERLHLDPEEGDGVLIRAVRGRGTSRTVYPGPSAEAQIAFDATCPSSGLPWTPPATPTPKATPPPTTASPEPGSGSGTPATGPPTTDGGGVPGTTDDAGATARTSSPGQPGFTALSGVVGLLSLLVLRRRVGSH